jgi:hypothetical protein
MQKAHGHFHPCCVECKTSALPPLLILQRHGKADVLAAQVPPAISGWRERLPRKASTPTELAKEILSYFLRNPHAADSLEGVTRWRLMEERVHRELENTDQALNWLVRRGFLVKVSSEWTGSVYQLNDVNRSMAERFVSEFAKPASRAANERRRSSSK